MQAARAPATAAGAVDAASAGEWAAALIQSRCTVLPKRLAAPGPDRAQLAAILGAAAAAPDHGELLPWRFVLVPERARPALADVFEQSLLERDPAASPAQCAQAREKAFRAPVLLLAIAALGGAPEIPAAERLVSAGCALQNMLLMATALGFGSALTSGKALQSDGLRRLFALRRDEQALCFLSLGTVASSRPRRARPGMEQYVSELEVPS
ncbi:nitroreductase family protein [Caenimonas terrae]|uniref:Putative NAD(P)H nitroreductase n=1 Tax=Caenimonas terrae TaxID=696074 RepID=A0ABW0NB05_9BURK